MKPDQKARFEETAREIGCDETGEAFEHAFGKIVPPKVPAGRDSPELTKKRAANPDLDRFLHAVDMWAVDGVAKITCDQCNAVIRFRPEGSITWHECDCGKFNGVLRGL